MRDAEAAGLDNRPQSENSADTDVMQMFRVSMSSSTDYLNANYRRQWADSDANFHGKHPAGSKYHTDTYKARSKLFMPKTRGSAERIKAAGSSAFFSTREVARVSAENEQNPNHAAAASFWHEALEYRLTKRMPWYSTVIGAIEDCFTYGVCFTHNYWRYELDGNGDVVHDTLWADLIPVENVRFSPAADWRDPINDSPVVVHVIPMTVDEVRFKIFTGEWSAAAEPHIHSATKPFGHNTTRDSRQTDRMTTDRVPGHQIVYVHKVILREMNIDYVFYVLGDTHLLTQPTPLKDVIPGGFRNYTMGRINLEAHTPYPQSQGVILSDLQADLNEIVNSRRDNIMLSMHKRYLVKSDARMDFASMMRNAPGGVIVTRNPNEDVREIKTSDVTGSAYREQEYTSSYFDDAAGTFNQASINTNRRLNETVGGMELLASDANMMSEFKLEVFAQEWVQPTLRQMLQLEQAYETDFVVQAFAAEKAELVERYGVTELTDELLSQRLMLEVNVGIDATNPARAMERLQALASLGSQLGVPINGEEIYKEAAGRLGYADGSRFVVKQDPNAPQEPSPEQQAMAAQQAAAEQQAQMEAQQAQAKLQTAQMDVETKQLRAQTEAVKTSQIHEIELAKLALEKELTIEELKIRLGIAMQQDQTERDIALLRAENQHEPILVDAYNTY